MKASTVGYLADAVLYADLRDRLAGRAELVDLGGLDLEAVRRAVPSLDVLLHHPRLPLTAEVVLAGERLRAVLAPGAGYDGIPLDAAASHGILVTNQAGCNDEAVAEHAICLMLSVAKRVAEGDRRIRSGSSWHAAMYFNHEIRGLTLGIIGLGAIGRRLAQIAGAGFGMRILAYDTFVSEPPDSISMLPLDDLLVASDIVSVHVPLTDETRGLLGARELDLMKDSAILVNTARGHIVDQGALTDALAGGALRGAGLDVLDDDVLDADHPLLSMENVVMTPHIAGATYESLETQAVRQADAVLAILVGRVPETANVLNPAGVDRFLERFGRSATGASDRDLEQEENA